MNSKLVARLDDAECAFFNGIMSGTNDMLGRDAARFIVKPGVQALFAPTVKDPLFNRAILSDACVVQDVLEILDQYAGAGVEPALEISPGALNEELSAALFSRSYSQVEFLPVLVARADSLPEKKADLRVSNVESKDEMQAFKNLLIEGWTIPPAQFPETLTSSVEKWIALPGCSLFLAYDGDEAISCGILHFHQGLAFLAVSATPPAYRGRGGQSAIDRARILAAKGMGAELIWSRTHFGTTSQRNKEKLGLNVLYARAGWKKVQS